LLAPRLERSPEPDRNMVQVSHAETGGLVGNRQLSGFSPSSSQSIEASIVDPRVDSDWDRLVLSHPASNLFHRAAWANVLCRTYGHRPTYLCLRRRSELVALVPLMEVTSPVTGRRGVSLPFSDFCEPLLFGECAPDSLTEVLSDLGRERRWRYFELRGGKKILPKGAVAAERYYGHKLDLRRGANDIFARFRSPVRRAIRKAEKSGLVVEIAKNRKAILDFYRLHLRTRRRHGLPPQPLSFFLHIEEEILKGDLGFVVLAKNRMNPIAATVFFHSGGEVLFKFGASDERSHEFRGNNLVMWEGIQELVKKGLKTLYFGRTSARDEGLRRFKLSWRTEEGPVEYFKFALGKRSWKGNRPSGFGLHNQLFGRLPLTVNRLAGRLIYSHLD
jgi:hypothetical protein